MWLPWEPEEAVFRVGIRGQSLPNHVLPPFPQGDAKAQLCSSLLWMETVGYIRDPRPTWRLIFSDVRDLFMYLKGERNIFIHWFIHYP